MVTDPGQVGECMNAKWEKVAAHRKRRDESRSARQPLPPQPAQEPPASYSQQPMEQDERRRGAGRKD